MGPVAKVDVVNLNFRWNPFSTCALRNARHAIEHAAGYHDLRTRTRRDWWLAPPIAGGP